MPLDNIGGVSLTTIATAFRFLGALWAAVGLSYFLWGMVDYYLHHGGQDKIAKGFMFLLGFTIVWGCVKIFNSVVFG